ncbi:MAG: hypothetical protein R2717_00105 [Schumannella sp.]
MRRRELRDLVVVTSALPIALALEPAIPRYEVVVTGGTLRPAAFARQPVRRAHARRVAVRPRRHRLYGRRCAARCHQCEPRPRRIKSLVLRSAQRAVLVADASKLGRVDPAVIAPLDRFDALVTAGEAPAGELDALRAGGLDVVVLG